MDNYNFEYCRQEQMQQKLQHLRDPSPDCVDGILQMELISCDEKQDACVFRFRTKPWMRNAVGTLHGGMSATILDHAMGALLYCIKDGGAFCPTIEMQTSYHRPLAPGKDVLVRARAISLSRSMAHMAAEVFQADEPDKVCVSGTAIYFLTD